tara:strand:+ start:5138 stop:5776 length:639 start_codon:yes stop_codon:yes gene_type:complete
MKLTKSRLQQLVKEETSKALAVLKEEWPGTQPDDHYKLEKFTMKIFLELQSAQKSIFEKWQNALSKKFVGTEVSFEHEKLQGRGQGVVESVRVFSDYGDATVSFNVRVPGPKGGKMYRDVRWYNQLAPATTPTMFSEDFDAGFDAEAAEAYAAKVRRANGGRGHGGRDCACLHPGRRCSHGGWPSCNWESHFIDGEYQTCGDAPPGAATDAS